MGLAPVVTIGWWGQGQAGERRGDEGPAAIQHLVFVLILLVPEDAIFADAAFFADPPPFASSRRLVGLLFGGVGEIGPGGFGFGFSIGVACRRFLIVVPTELGPR